MNIQSQLQSQPVSRSLAASLLLVAGGMLLLTLSAQVRIPLPFTPVPFTGQVLAVMLLGGLLGPRLAPAAVLGYLLLGVAGAPVFNGWAGGLGVLAGATGGYLLAFAPAAALYGLLCERLMSAGYALRVGGALVAGLAATVVIYLGGWAWLVGVLHLAPAQAWALGVLPFAPLDAYKAVIAALALGLWPRKV